MMECVLALPSFAAKVSQGRRCCQYTISQTPEVFLHRGGHSLFSYVFLLAGIEDVHGTGSQQNNHGQRDERL